MADVDLPEANAPWPPAGWASDAKLIDEAKLWLIGDIAKLADFYASTKRTDAAQWRAILAAIRRRQRDATAPQTGRLHVPLPRRIARVSAKLLFGEMPTFEAETSAVAERIATLAEDDGWASKLLEAAHVASGEGGVYLRPVWDKDVAPYPLLTIVHHDAAIPSFRFGRLDSVIFVEELEREASGRVWRHLELHQRGRIQHALYVGTIDRVGRPVRLENRPETEPFAGPSGDGVIDLLAIGIDRLLPAYVPNMLPNARTLSGTVGSADTAGMEDQLAAVDDADSSWARDVRVAKSMVIVPDEYLERGPGRGSGATFDMDREVFSPLDIDVEKNQRPIEVVQFDIRNDAFDATIRSRSDRIAIDAGYSPQSFGVWADGAAQTATEVNAREDASEATTKVKRKLWEPALAHVIESMLWIDAKVFSSGVAPEAPTVVWPSDDHDDPEATARKVQAWTIAEAASTETKVRELHPDWTDTEVAAEVQRIQNEGGMAVPDPTGGAFG